MRGKKGGGDVRGGSEGNGEPFLPLSPPDLNLMPLSGHSYIHQDAFALHFNEHQLEVMLSHQHSETTGISYNWQRARIDNHTHDSESWRH